MKAQPIEQLLDKYELSYPLARKQKRRILQSKKKTLSAILKKEVYDSPAVSAAVFFDYLLTSIGFKSSPARGARVFAAAVSFTVILVLSVPAVMLVNYFQLFQPMVAVSDLKPYEKGTVLFLQGDVNISRGFKDITQLKVQDVIATGDRITTAKDSSILFRMDTDVVRLMADSECSTRLLLDKKLLTLNQGKILCRVQHKKVMEFKVLTPNAEVLVVGTVFSVAYEDSKTIVSVTSGIVEVTNRETGQVEKLEKGKTAEVGDETLIRDSEKKENLILQLFEALDLPDLETEKNEKAYIKLRNDVIAMDMVYDELSMIKTLDDIKKKFGMMAVVDLYNGQRIKGAIISRGREFTLVTVEGIIKVKAKDVKNVRVMR